MRRLEIFLVVFLGAFCLTARCNPVDSHLELDSNANSSFDEQEIMATASEATEEEALTTNNPVLRNAEKDNTGKPETGRRRTCTENRNRNQNQTKSKTGSERLIPYPLCKPIQGLFYTGLCAIVCGLPLKSTENNCRFSNEDKTVFCDCSGAEEGDSAVCGAGMEKMSHCNYPELAPNAKVCSSVCRRLGKTYDFCMTPRHSRRAYCTCFDPSRTQRKGSSRETAKISKPIEEEIVVAKPQFENLQEEIQDDDDDVDIDVDEDLDESCDDGPKNGTVIQKLRQKNTGSCHPVLSAYKMKICNGICGSSEKSCRVSKNYKTVFCDCAGNEVGPTAFCGKPAELYNHCFRKSTSNVKDCRSICSEMGKRGELCLSPQQSQGLPLCSCFTQ